MTFRKRPFTPLSNEYCAANWTDIGSKLLEVVRLVQNDKCVVALETYAGIFEEVIYQFQDILQPVKLVNTNHAFLEEKALKEKTFSDTTNDRIFGRITEMDLMDLMDEDKVSKAKRSIDSVSQGLVLVAGPGAVNFVDHVDVLIYVDVSRWEIQKRMRSNQIGNLGLSNLTDNIENKYKRGFFLDWRICDRIRKEVIHSLDFYLDVNDPTSPKMITDKQFSKALEKILTQPFSLVPFFDPGPWGGQWMKDKFDLDKNVSNYAWCFNCVPEENSLLFQLENEILEMPAINVVYYQPVELLGLGVYQHYGAEFPIRFDFLDTMGGGNLSLQVHPTEEYACKYFNIDYTQHESYYIMDAGPDAKVYLGLNKGVGLEFIDDLKKVSEEGGPFCAEKYVKTWPSQKHKHFSIPAGTIHCSGKNNMVLEISATPYLFTFKLWDWGRMGLDGKPRPINIERGKEVICWDRDEVWVSEYLVDQTRVISKGDGWVEEKTGLHESQHIETRRHWFTKPVRHKGTGSVQVLNLVEGDRAIVESVNGKFEPFVVHYAETFIVPACIDEYIIRPDNSDSSREMATIKAWIRLDHPEKNYEV